MRALWLEDNQLRLREDVPLPSRPSEALVKVRLAGVCRTDLEMVKGYYPFTGVPGHEFVGEVVRSPETWHAHGEWVGKRVVGEINASCKRCEQCLGGRPTHCERRTVLGIRNRDGVFADYVNLPPENLHLVPDSVPDAAAVFVEPLAAALEIQQQIPIKPTDRILLLGAGRLGQLIAQTLALTGADMRVVARHPLQRRLLSNRGIELIDEAGIQAGRYDVVVEATGSKAGFELARKAVRPRGTLVLKSTYQGHTPVNLSPVVVDEITIVGSRCGPFPPALRLLEKKAVDPTVLIAAQFGLADSILAFEEAGKPNILKVLVKPNE